MIIIIIFTLILIIIRILTAPKLSLYKHCSIWIKIRIALFSPKCNYCGQIACRQRDPGAHLYCLRDTCFHKAHPYNPFGQASHPLNTLGWKYNKIK